MREINCTQQNPQYGTLSVTIRFVGHDMYMKFSKGNPQANQMIEQMRMKGAEIEEGNGWYKINMFKGQTYVKLGEREFNVNETSDDEVEEILLNFYHDKYIEAKFIVKEVK